MSFIKIQANDHTIDMIFFAKFYDNAKVEEVNCPFGNKDS